MNFFVIEIFIIETFKSGVCDNGFQAGRGAHAIVLSLLEEGKFNWLDLSSIQKVRECYSYRSHASRSIVADQVFSTTSVRLLSGTSNRVNKGSERRRICRIYNTGTSRYDTSHSSKGSMHEHFCSFCATKGSKLNH